MDTSLDALVAQARSALDGHVPAVADDGGGPYQGSAADGLITAEVDIDGRVRSLAIDPKALNRPLAEVTAEVRAAINAALRARPATADFAPLVAELEAVQEQARRSMASIMSAIAGASQRVREARG